MPESCTDRPTTAHEHLFLLSKRSRYFYDADAIREEHKPESLARYEYGLHVKAPNDGFISAGSDTGAFHSDRNKRTVWEIPTYSYAGAHFATFPPKLVEPCILAGTSPRACEICGAPWQRMMERTPEIAASAKGSRFDRGKTGTRDGGDRTQQGERFQKETTGWQPTCSCDSEGKGRCLVLDPFAGSGTTGEVALKHGRDYLLIELNRDYEELIRRRLGLFYNS